MSGLWVDMKAYMADMLEPPWRDTESDDIGYHWLMWFVGWIWAIGGLVLGALYAPSLLQFAGLSDTPYQDWLVIGVAVVAGFLLQFLGWFLFASMWAVFFSDSFAPLINLTEARSILVRLVVYPLAVVIVSLLSTAFVVPFAVIGYGIYRYLNWVGTGQGLVTIAFVGALLVKTFLIPFIKGIVTGALFRWFMKWLRGGKDTKKAD
jgi:hypothetical protein